MPKLVHRPTAKPLTAISFFFSSSAPSFCKLYGSLDMVISCARGNGLPDISIEWGATFQPLRVQKFSFCFSFCRAVALSILRGSAAFSLWNMSFRYYVCDCVFEIRVTFSMILYSLFSCIDFFLNNLSVIFLFLCEVILEIICHFRVIGSNEFLHDKCP